MTPLPRRQTIRRTIPVPSPTTIPIRARSITASSSITRARSSLPTASTPTSSLSKAAPRMSPIPPSTNSPLHIIPIRRGSTIISVTSSLRARPISSPSSSMRDSTSAVRARAAMSSFPPITAGTSSTAPSPLSRTKRATPSIRTPSTGRSARRRGRSPTSSMKRIATSSSANMRRCASPMRSKSSRMRRSSTRTCTPI